MAHTTGQSPVQAAVVALAEHVTARCQLGVSTFDMSVRRFTKLLVQATILHGVMEILQESSSERILDEVFAPYLVSSLHFASVQLATRFSAAQLPDAPPGLMALSSKRLQPQNIIIERAACLPQRDDNLYCTAFELWQKVSAPVGFCPFAI